MHGAIIPGVSGVDIRSVQGESMGSATVWNGNPELVFSHSLLLRCPTGSVGIFICSTGLKQGLSRNGPFNKSGPVLVF